VLFTVRLENVVQAPCLHTSVRGTPDSGYRQRPWRAPSVWVWPLVSSAAAAVGVAGDFWQRHAEASYGHCRGGHPNTTTTTRPPMHCHLQPTSTSAEGRASTTLSGFEAWRGMEVHEDHVLVGPTPALPSTPSTTRHPRCPFLHRPNRSRGVVVVCHYDAVGAYGGFGARDLGKGLGLGGTMAWLLGPCFVAEGPTESCSYVMPKVPFREASELQTDLKIE
jgi:hypothetical protein